MKDCPLSYAKSNLRNGGSALVSVQGPTLVSFFTLFLTRPVLVSIYIYICAIQLHIYVRGYISGWVETFQSSFLGLPPSSASDWSFVLDRITIQNFQLSHVSVAIIHPPPPASPWPVGSSNALDIFSRMRCFVSLFAYCRTHSLGWSNRSVETEFCAL